MDLPVVQLRPAVAPGPLRLAPAQPEAARLQEAPVRLARAAPMVVGRAKATVTLQLAAVRQLAARRPRVV